MDAVCFDLDGTLFDDRQYVRAGLDAAAAWLREETGLDLAAEFREAYFDRGVRDRTFDVVLAEAGLSDDLVPELVTAYHDNDAPLEPYPAAVETLETLASGYDLALVTGGRNGRLKLARLGLEAYFDVVVVTATREDTKRDPGPFRDALDALRTAPERAVAVGDRPELDLRQPSRLGMSTVRIRTGQYADREAGGSVRPDATVRGLAELPDTLSDLG